MHSGLRTALALGGGFSAPAVVVGCVLAAAGHSQFNVVSISIIVLLLTLVTLPIFFHLCYGAYEDRQCAKRAMGRAKSGAHGSMLQERAAATAATTANLGGGGVREG